MAEELVSLLPGRPRAADLTTEQGLLLVTHAKWTNFAKSDWMTFSGCESEHPRLGEVVDYLIVLDGDVLNILDSREDEAGATDAGALFRLEKMT